MTKKVELTLWLHEGRPEGAATWWKGERFLSVFSFDAPLSGEEPAALATAAGELEGHHAVLVMTGADPASEKPLLYLRAGEVASLLRETAGLALAKASPFDRLYLLGAESPVDAGAPGLLRLEAGFRRSGVWNVVSEKSSDTVEGTTAEVCLADWRFLLKVARVDLLDRPNFEESVRPEAPLRAEPVARSAVGARSVVLFCNGRGADARAKLEKNGLRILAGSRSSPLDATLSLSQPYREKVKRLVNEEKLKKIDGVWTFVEDVKMSSSVEAASILMRTSAGADNWKTEEGETLVALIGGRMASR